jgi:hypothetical protein
MNLRNGTDELIDSEGADYESLDALRKSVLATARDLMGHDMAQGLIDLRFRIDAEDTDGVIVYTLHFKHAVTSFLKGSAMLDCHGLQLAH